MMALTSKVFLITIVVLDTNSPNPTLNLGLALRNDPIQSESIQHEEVPLRRPFGQQ